MVNDQSSRKNKLSQLESIYIEDGSLPDDLQDLRTILETDGVNLSDPKLTKGLQDSQRPIREQVDEERRNSRQRPDGFVKFRNFALNTRDIVALFFSLLFFSVFPLLAIVSLFTSEVLSAILGTQTFMGDGFEAFVGVVLSVTITSFFFVLEWRRASLEYMLRQNKKTEKKYRRTMADSWRMWQYRLSRDPNIERIEIEDTEEIDLIKKTKRVGTQVMMLLVALGVLGRLADDLEKYKHITWHETILKIITGSSLIEFLEIFAAAFVAVILLNGTSYVLSMIYENFAQIGVDQSDNFFSESSGLQRLQDQEKLFWRGVILARIKKKSTHIERKYKKMTEETQATEEDSPNLSQDTSNDLPNSNPTTSENLTESDDD